MSLLKHAEREGRLYQNPVPTAEAGLSIALKVLPLYLSNKAETEPRERLGPL